MTQGTPTNDDPHELGGPGPLVGRDPELELIGDVVHRIETGSAALLLTGDAGVGKSALLREARAAAQRHGVRVISAAGVEFEAAVPYASLNQILRESVAEIAEIPPALGEALRIALGIEAGPPPPHLTVLNALLALLDVLVADGGPLLLVVDDVQWCDPATAGLLASAARRFAGRPIGLLAAARPGADGPLLSAGLDEHEVLPLDGEASTQLMRARFPSLSAPVRSRLLAEAQGNPLALLELPRTLSGPQRTAGQALPEFLPLSRRLEVHFGSQIGVLPAETRALLLLAALEGTAELRVLERTAPERDRRHDLAPAERSRLVTVEDGRLAFRHPLIRSAVVEASTDEERHRAHLALAEALSDQPERQVWHLAGASSGPDGRIAEQLERAARRLLVRGDAGAAVGAMTRAADLSPEAVDRCRRLGEAAYLSANLTGDVREIDRMLAEAREVGRGLGRSLPAAAAGAFVLLNGGGDVDNAHRLLVEAIAHRQPADEGPTLVNALWMLLFVCLLGGRPELWEPLDRMIEEDPDAVPADLRLCARIHRDPAAAVAASGAEVEATIRSLDVETQPYRIVAVATGLVAADRLGECWGALLRVAEVGRKGGAVNMAVAALMHLAREAYLAGEWAQCERLADEGLELCRAHGYAMHERWFCHCQAFVAAVRGDDAELHELIAKMARWSSTANTTMAIAHHPAALSALGRGDFDAAYRHATAISPAGQLPRHVPEAHWALMDVVEAAVRTERADDAVAHVAAMEAAAAADVSPRTATMVLASRGMVAEDDDDATDLFEAALARARVARSPFLLARVHLLHGEQLRRRRATARARTHLRAALEIFERLGAEPWSGRTHKELRAAGVGRKARRADPSSLTDQEREVAELVAIGLTNKEVARRLYVSPRTVSAHLYHIFPKLGIATRAALRDALGPAPGADPAQLAGGS